MHCLLHQQSFIYGLELTGLSHNSQSFKVAVNFQNSSMYLEYQHNISFSFALQLTQTSTTLARSSQILAGKSVVYAYRFRLRLLPFAFVVWGKGMK